jgi:flavin reductase (DIM6/NTAB) family NADH-FMN oxidoreductase RutF
MKATSYSEAIRRKYPEPVALAVSMDRGRRRANIITLGWCMCTSGQPPMLAISVGHTRHSHATIREGGEFVVSFPSEDQAEAARFCGTVSGRDHDKFAESGLRPLRASKVAPPLIAEACANFECRLVASCESGDHTIFVGEVVASHAAEHARGRLYTLPSGELGGVR